MAWSTSRLIWLRPRVWCLPSTAAHPRHCMCWRRLAPRWVGCWSVGGVQEGSDLRMQQHWCTHPELTCNVSPTSPPLSSNTTQGTLGPYKVKIMLAEPKTKRSAAAAAALGVAAAGLPGASAAAGLRALEGLGLGAHMSLQHAALLAQQVRLWVALCCQFWRRVEVLPRTAVCG